MDIKKLTILNIVLAIAVVVLFVMHFACGSCPAPATDTATDKTASENDSASADMSHGVKIGWANSDTVTKYYQLAEKHQAKLLEDQALAQGQLENAYSKYEKKKAALEKEAPILGQNELQKKIQELQMMEQEIMMQEQTLQNDLMNKEYAANESYLQMTHEFMQKIGKDLGYDYVISYRLGGQVIYANPAHEITDEIIEGLNYAYKNHGAE